MFVRRVCIALTILLIASSAGGAPASAASEETFRPPESVSAAGPQHPAVPAPRRNYLALGDSLSAGYQPRSGDARFGGYAGLVAAATRTRLSNLACTGETAVTMLAGGRCRYREGSQLRAATRWLRAHPSTSLVTVSIGANDMRRCVTGTTVSLACVEKRLTALRGQLPAILRSVRAAAPHATIVALDYYNPYLSADLAGASRLSSINSSLLQFRLNSAIGEAARVSGARVARVADAFDSTSLWREDVPGLGRVPRRVARICTWTWMCSRLDIHPNNTGYRVLAGAVLARLDR